ncbi:MAG TPA: sigma-54-dependent Fis family transcriptional regulator [bacterium]|nr:sigma-54-dependent Fis family transcriptional regulator [bacterium]
MRKLNALLVDDDLSFCQTFQNLSQQFFKLKYVNSGKDALAELKTSVPDVVFLDYRLGRGMDGLQVLKRIKQLHQDLPVIMITHFADVETAVEAMKLGAFHYTSKSPNIEALKLIIERQLEQLKWKQIYEQEKLEREQPCVAESPSMQGIMKQIHTIARTDSTVLIEGECGVGKEVCARQIHLFSPRKDNPFVAVNCSTLSPQLFESEFFGHEKGAFTGAHIQKKGKLEIADSGTIFLDEIGDLPLESQAKILRAVEEKQFERLGGTETIKIDVRIKAASNKDLKKLTRQKLFREDLYYRLSVISLCIPPLRERRQDIPPLLRLFLRRFSDEMRRLLP